jgi:hypothetical protein
MTQRAVTLKLHFVPVNDLNLFDELYVAIAYFVIMNVT